MVMVFCWLVLTLWFGIGMLSAPEPPPWMAQAAPRASLLKWLPGGRLREVLAASALAERKELETQASGEERRGLLDREADASKNQQQAEREKEQQQTEESEQQVREDWPGLLKHAETVEQAANYQLAIAAMQVKAAQVQQMSGRSDYLQQDAKRVQRDTATTGADSVQRRDRAKEDGVQQDTSKTGTVLGQRDAKEGGVRQGTAKTGLGESAKEGVQRDTAKTGTVLGQRDAKEGDAQRDTAKAENNGVHVQRDTAKTGNNHVKQDAKEGVQQGPANRGQRASSAQISRVQEGGAPNGTVAMTVFGGLTNQWQGLVSALYAGLLSGRAVVTISPLLFFCLLLSFFLLCSPHPLLSPVRSPFPSSSNLPTF
jgi:hypothetical protein